MAEMLVALILAKWPHISPNGILFGCIVIMALGLAVALKWPEKPQKK
ncbi:MAG: hypothetical protein AB1679_08780 [Actinomycetota bacterium]|jgi:hypothetical protein